MEKVERKVQFLKAKHYMSAKYFGVQLATHIPPPTHHPLFFKYCPKTAGT